jgi:hypothetical protein
MSIAAGMGMGLSIARTIIEAHHGQIWAKNQVHGGASFGLSFLLSDSWLSVARPRRSGPDFRQADMAGQSADVCYREQSGPSRVADRGQLLTHSRHRCPTDTPHPLVDLSCANAQ